MLDIIVMILCICWSK